MIMLPLLILALIFGIGVELIAPSTNTFVDMFNFIIGFLVSILDIILYPINFLVVTYMPGLNDALVTITEYFNYANTYMSWIFSAFGVPTFAVTLASSYYLFTWTIQFSAYSFKLLLKWKNALL